MDCSRPGSSAHGVLQARILEWVALSFARGSFPPRDRTCVSCIVGGLFTDWATRESDVGIACWDLGAWECELESELGSLGFSFYAFAPVRCHEASRSAGRRRALEKRCPGRARWVWMQRTFPRSRGWAVRGRQGVFTDWVFCSPAYPTPERGMCCCSPAGGGLGKGTPRLPGPWRPLPSPRAAPGRGGWLWSSGMGVSGLFWVWPEITHTPSNCSPQYLHTGDLSLHWLR